MTHEDDDDDRIPSTESYRGIAIHAGQPPARIALVKKAIDAVYDVSDLGELFSVLSNPRQAPEARLFAGAKLLASYQSAAGSRVSRPRIDRTAVEGHVAALRSRRWRCPTHYGSLLEIQDGLVPRERPLGALK